MNETKTPIKLRERHEILGAKDRGLIGSVVEIEDIFGGKAVGTFVKVDETDYPGVEIYVEQGEKMLKYVTNINGGFNPQRMVA